MNPECAACRWLLVYPCPRVPQACRFHLPQFQSGGKDCPKFQERPA